MKLTKLFLATCAIAAAFTGCTSGDGFDPETAPAVDAHLSFSANTTEALTKAADDTTHAGIGKEAFVQRLTAFVYKSDGTLYVVKDSSNATSGVWQLKDITVKVQPKDADFEQATDTKYQMIVAGNLSDAAVATLKAKTFTDAQTALVTDIYGTTTTGELLPMVSKAFDNITGLFPAYPTGATAAQAPKQNWVYNNSGIITTETTYDADKTNYIVLTRLVARVQLGSISTAFTGTMTGASFTLKSLSLINVRKNSTLLTSSALVGTAPYYIKGYQSAAYAVTDKWIDPACKDVVNSSLQKSYNINVTEQTNSTYTFTSSNIFMCYAYENPLQTASNGVYQTALLVSGTYKSPLGNSTDVNFRIYIGEGTTYQVVRNTIYDIQSITIKGEGSPNEDNILANAYIALKISVTPWKVISWKVEDAN